MGGETRPGGDEIDEDTKRLLVKFVENGNESRVVKILDKVGWNILNPLSAKQSFQLWYPGGQRLKVISFS